MSLSQSSWNGAAFGNIQKADKFNLKCGHGHLYNIAVQQLMASGIYQQNISVVINVTSPTYNKQHFRSFVDKLIASYQYQQQQESTDQEFSSFYEFDSMN